MDQNHTISRNGPYSKRVCLLVLYALCAGSWIGITYGIVLVIRVLR